MCLECCGCNDVEPEAPEIAERRVREAVEAGYRAAESGRTLDVAQADHLLDLARREKWRPQTW